MRTNEDVEELRIHKDELSLQFGGLTAGCWVVLLYRDRGRRQDKLGVLK